MQKTNVLVFSLAALLAISAVTGVTLQEAEAADNKWKFKKHPSFIATLDAVNPTDGYCYSQILVG